MAVCLCVSKALSQAEEVEMESAAFVATCLHTPKVGEEASLGAKGTGMGLSGLIYSQDRQGGSVLVID